MRLVIISNRLPVTLQADRSIQPRRSIGGLATGLDAYVQTIREGQTQFDDVLWIGWPGASVKKSQEALIIETYRELYNYRPVFLKAQLVDNYYNEFCNKVIWPLFHGFPDKVHHNNDSWQYFQKANACFAAVVKEELRPGDVIWVHDYHLMLLPDLIRKDFPALTISYFLHVPFPGLNIFRQLPSEARTGLLRGLLGADLIGFHTSDYAADFLASIKRYMNLSADEGHMEVEGRSVKVDVFPMGIDYPAIKAIAGSAACIELKKSLALKYDKFSIILSIDRLDYTKGIINRLIAYHNFLISNRQFAGKVVLLLVVAPSRREIESYAQLKRQIDEWVGKINGVFGKDDWTPVIYQYRELSITELCALYGISDVCLVTPFCDGMNLIAKEFVVSCDHRKAVLVLSEMAGAIWQLKDAVSVNPFTISQLTDAIRQALTMTTSEKQGRMTRLDHAVKSYDILRWAEQNLTLATLAHYKEEQRQLQAACQ